MALGLLVTGLMLMWADRGGPPQTSPTLVAAADIDAGAVVRDSDVQLVAWPIESRPTAASAPDAVVGRHAIGPIKAGEALTEHRVVGPSAIGSAGPGKVAVALPEEPMSILIRPGDRVDVVGRVDAGPRTLAAGARVLALSEGTRPIVAVPASAAASVVAAAATGSVAVVLLGD